MTVMIYGVFVLRWLSSLTKSNGFFTLKMNEGTVSIRFACMTESVWSAPLWLSGSWAEASLRWPHSDCPGTWGWRLKPQTLLGHETGSDLINTNTQATHHYTQLHFPITNKFTQ